MIERKRLPNRRGSENFEFQHYGLRYTVTASLFSDGQLAEVFIDCGKAGSTAAVHAQDSAVLTSLLLQHGVTAATIRHSIAGPIATALDLVTKAGAV